ncbi:MAG: OmpH family outer membrane protein [Rikenellaceae bacterium]
MKKILFAITLILAVTVTTASAQQKVAYIYSEKVFKAMPDYSKAVASLDVYAKSAQTETKNKLNEVRERYNQYIYIEHSLSQTQKETMKQQIMELEEEANNYEDEFFAEGGAMSKKRDQLMQPLEQKVIDAVEKLASEGKYDMIFDLSVAAVAIYKNPTLDLTDKVISIVNGQ